MKVCVLGAGAIGGYIGSCLSLGLSESDLVVLIGRESLLTAAAKSEQHVLLDSCMQPQAEFLASNGQGRIKLGEKLRVTAEESELSGVDVVLLAVKSQHTREAAKTLAKYIGEDCVVVSLQNGVSNPKKLREELPKNAIVAGMVGFNVIWRDDGASFANSTGR